MKHPVIERRFSVDPVGIEPIVTADNAPFWEALDRGEFIGQYCLETRRFQLPGGPACAISGSTALEWRALSGLGTVFSWVRYHKSYLPEFTDVLPYLVGTIELDEGPRMFARLVDCDRDPRFGEDVCLVIERWPSGRSIPSFRPLRP